MVGLQESLEKQREIYNRLIEGFTEAVRRATEESINLVEREMRDSLKGRGWAVSEEEISTYIEDYQGLMWDETESRIALYKNLAESTLASIEAALKDLYNDQD